MKYYGMIIGGTEAVTEVEFEFKDNDEVRLHLKTSSDFNKMKLWEEEFKGDLYMIKKSMMNCLPPVQFIVSILSEEGNPYVKRTAKIAEVERLTNIKFA